MYVHIYAGAPVCMCTCVQRSEVIYLYHSLYFLDYIYLSVPMYTRVCMPQWTCGGQRTTCGNQSSPLPHRSCQGLNSGCHGAPLSTKPSYWHATLFFETRCITKLRTRWFTLLGGQKASEICLCPMSPSAGITHAAIFTLVVGTQTQIGMPVLYWLNYLPLQHPLPPAFTFFKGWYFFL